jgi:predicted AAA+ superfamily ATPase
MEIRRRLLEPGLELLGGFRALVVNGPRQSGKSTLVRQIQSSRGSVVTLDDPAMLRAAIEDPVGFVASLDSHVAIDEFQRAGDSLLLALKMRLDASQQRGQFLLAGSTRLLSMRRLSETLTGRVGILELMPCSAGELRGAEESFLDRTFAGALLDDVPEPMTRRDYADAIVRGGFPELALGPPTARFRSSWCDGYLRTVTAVANVEQVSEVRRPELLMQLTSQLAARSGGEVNVADLAREVGASADLVRAYLDILSTLYLIRLLPGWTTSRTNRAKRRPVVHLIDTALAANLLGETVDSLPDPTSRWFGPLLESFVANEIARQASWADRPTTIAHYRDRDQREIDVVLERGREVVGIEVKATATPLPQHARHLAYVRDRLGDRFRSGVVLHTGSQRLPLGDRLVAVPVASLWA